MKNKIKNWVLITHVEISKGYCNNFYIWFINKVRNLASSRKMTLDWEFLAEKSFEWVGRWFAYFSLVETPRAIRNREQSSTALKNHTSNVSTTIFFFYKCTAFFYRMHRHTKMHTALQKTWKCFLVHHVGALQKLIYKGLGINLRTYCSCWGKYHELRAALLALFCLTQNSNKYKC